MVVNSQVSRRFVQLRHWVALGAGVQVGICPAQVEWMQSLAASWLFLLGAQEAAEVKTGADGGMQGGLFLFWGRPAWPKTEPGMPLVAGSEQLSGFAELPCMRRQQQGRGQASDRSGSGGLQCCRPGSLRAFRLQACCVVAAGRRQLTRRCCAPQHWASGAWGRYFWRYQDIFEVHLD